MILLSGVSGHLGGATLEHLLQRMPAEQISVMVRTDEQAQRFRDRGLNVRFGDYDDSESLRTAFDGVDTFFFVSSMSPARGEQQRAVVDAIAQTGISRIVYTGLAIRDITTSATRYLMQSHFDTERAIRETGVPHTILRNTMYAEAIPQIVGPTATEAELRLAGGSGRVPYALRAELAEAAAEVLHGAPASQEVLSLVGDAELGYAEIAEGLSARRGQAVAYAAIDPASYAEELRKSPLPEFVQALTANTVSDIADGQYQVQSHDLARLLGRRPASAQEIFDRVLSSF